MEVSPWQTNSLSLLLVCLFLLKTQLYRICWMTVKSKSNGNVKCSKRVRQKIKIRADRKGERVPHAVLSQHTDCVCFFSLPMAPLPSH